MHHTSLEPVDAKTVSQKIPNPSVPLDQHNDIEEVDQDLLNSSNWQHKIELGYIQEIQSMWQYKLAAAKPYMTFGKENLLFFFNEVKYIQLSL